MTGLLVEERLLQRRQHAAGRKPLDGRHRLSGQALDRTRAGERRLAVDQHHAGAALLGAAAEAAAAQAELVAQHRKQWRRAVARDVHRLAVDDEVVGSDTCRIGVSDSGDGCECDPRAEGDSHLESHVRTGGRR